MILTSEQILNLYKHIGYGPVDTARILIFGNEPGTAGGNNLQQNIDNLMHQYETRNLLKINKGFSMIEIDPSPVNSTFVQFIGRLCLAIQDQDERWFEKLTPSGITVLNNYIMNSVCQEHSALINLRPFPRPTERIWPYENICQKDYQSQFNFNHKHIQNDDLTKMRIEILKAAFDLNPDAIIIGNGDKENKRAFFKTIYPGIQFEEINYYDLKTYIAVKPRKIILANYFDNRSGIKLTGLQKVYKIIISPYFMR